MDEHIKFAVQVALELQKLSREGMSPSQLKVVEASDRALFEYLDGFCGEETEKSDQEN